jgi:hypothetical protein
VVVAGEEMVVTGEEVVAEGGSVVAAAEAVVVVFAWDGALRPDEMTDTSSASDIPVATTMKLQVRAAHREKADSAVVAPELEDAQVCGVAVPDVPE